MRVTFRTAFGGIEYVQTAAEQVANARRQVETGKRLSAPSDDPAATQRAIEGRAELSGLDTYARSADSAAAKLATLDTVLTDVVDNLTRASVAATSARGSTATAGSTEGCRWS